MDTTRYRDRIVGHRKIKAADLRPHPLNWRTHPAQQRAALDAVLGEVGIARSVLAYVAEKDRTGPNGTPAPGDPLTLIDGHGRRDVAPDAEWTVEVLDVSDAEARKLLLSLDPLSSLAGADTGTLDELLAQTEADDPILESLWSSIAADDAPVPGDDTDDDSPERNPPRGKKASADEEVSQWLVIITCKNERHQADVLRKLKQEGFKCKALMS
jgi:hypothetical protein